MPENGLKKDNLFFSLNIKKPRNKINILLRGFKLKTNNYMDFLMAACAEAIRAIGTLKGEQLT